ncbi:MAG TPA: hypothetical protein VIK77_05280, partial [Tissierellaceae bacterium]
MPLINGKYVVPDNGLKPLQPLDTPDNLTLASRIVSASNPHLRASVTPFEYGRISEYSDYVPFGYGANTNYDELRALNQGRLEKWLHGAGKFGVIAGTTILDGTIGTLVGIGNMLIEGEASAFWNNPFSVAMHSINTAAEELMPNFYSIEEQNMNAWQKLGTANFWADSILKNTGYAVGMIVPGMGWSTLGARAVKNMFPRLGKLAVEDAAKLGKLAEDAASGAVRGAALTDDIIKSTKNLNRFLPNLKNPNVPIGINQFFGSTMGAMAEARMEAIGSAEGIKEKLIQNGTWDKLTDAEKADIYSSAGNTTFALNLALLTASNFVQYKHLFNTPLEFNKIKANLVKGSDGLYKSGAKGVGRALITQFGKAVLAEGLIEEGTQFAIEQGVEHYNLQRAKDPQAQRTFKDVLDAAFYGLEQQFTTSQGWENMLAGAITSGIVMPSIGIGKDKDGKNKLQLGKGFRDTIKEAKEIQERSKIAANEVNQALDRSKKALFDLGVTDEELKAILTDEKVEGEKAKEIRAKRDLIISSLSTTLAREKALADGDIFEYKNLEAQELATDIFTLIKHNRLEDFLEMLDESRVLSGEQIREMLSEQVVNEKGEVKSVDPYEGLTGEEIEAQHRERIGKIKENVKKIQDIYRGIGFRTNGELSDIAHAQLTSLLYQQEDLDKRQENLSKEISSYFKEGLDSFIDYVVKNKKLTKEQEIIFEQFFKDHKLEGGKLDSLIDYFPHFKERVEDLVFNLVSSDEKAGEKAANVLAGFITAKGINDILSGENTSGKTLNEIASAIYDLNKIQASKKRVVYAVNQAFNNPAQFSKRIDGMMKGTLSEAFKTLFPEYVAMKDAKQAADITIKRQEEQKHFEASVAKNDLSSTSKSNEGEELKERLVAQLEDESRERHVYKGWDSFIVSSGNQELATAGTKQHRWYTFMESAKRTPGAFRFVAFGSNSIPEQYKIDGITFYDGEKHISIEEAAGKDIDDIVVLALNKDGSIYTIDGQPVFTSLITPTLALNGKDRFSYKQWIEINGEENLEAELEEALEDYKQFRDQIKSEAKYLQISEINPGVRNPGREFRELDIKDVIGDSPDIKVETFVDVDKKTTSYMAPNGIMYELIPGAGYVYFDGILQPIFNKTLSEASVDEIMKLLVFLANNPNNRAAFQSVTEYIKTIINTYYGGDRTNKYRFFPYMNKEGKFVTVYYGPNSLNVSDLLDSNSAGYKALRNFLFSKTYNIDKKALDSTSYNKVEVVNGVLKTTRVKGGYKSVLGDRFTINVAPKAQEDSVEALNPSRLNSTLVFSPIPAIKEQAPVKKEEPKKRQAKAK